MKRYIKASIDIDDYRGYYIVDEGNGYVIYDAYDDSKIGDSYDTILEAKLEIDNWLDDSTNNDITYEQQMLGDELCHRFIDYCNISRNNVDKYGVIHTDKMFRGQHITLARLQLALKRFNAVVDDKFEANGVFLNIVDTGHDYQIIIDYILP